MNLKQLITLFLLLNLSVNIWAIDPVETPTIKIYGFVGNDFFYNSRQNIESADGLIHLFPKLKNFSVSGVDLNGKANSELLSINSRIGLDIGGSTLLGAKSSAKIEADFAGTGGTFFLLRIRQAYAKLSWKKTELLLGQTWHPFFGSVVPTTLSANGGAPFQPFNRCPQLRLRYNFSNTLSATVVAAYQMQFASQGPTGTSNSYMKNAAIPECFLGIENKNASWITGIGFDIKTIRPTTLATPLVSTSGMIYAQFTHNLLTIKGKTIYGQNLSDQTMIGGYGMSNSTKETYTNFNTATGWLNGTYGNKWQIGFFIGYSKNLGTSGYLQMITPNNFTFYGFGTDCGIAQYSIDEIARLAPQLSYNLPNLKFMLEYNLDRAKYGKMKSNGTVNAYDPIFNHRAVASVCYLF